MQFHDVFCEITYQPGEIPEFYYRSGLAVYKEQFKNGSLVAAGWNTAGYLPSRKNMGETDAFDYLTEPAAFHLELNGQCADYGFRLVDFQIEKQQHAILVLESTIFPIRVLVHTSVDETQSFSRWLEVENLSEEPWSISRIAVYNGVLDSVRKKLPYPGDLLGDRNVAQEEYFSLGYFRDGGWGREGDFGWHKLHTESTVIDMRYTRSKFRHPLLFVRDHVLGRIWYWQMAWSAGCEFRLDHRQGYTDASDSVVSLTAELASHNPMLVLRGRERYTLPEIHFGVVQGDLDDAVNCMHAHTRNITLPEADPSSCAVIGAMECSCDMSVETTKERIRHFAEMGAEIFMIDAGWQCPPGKQGEHRKYNGTNIADPDRYPHGLAELADDCHAHGMKFGLWTEIERIGEYSPVYREHPQWRGVTKYGVRSETYLDMTIPEAAAWAERELGRIIEEYKLDVLRIDHVNPGSIHFAMRDTGTGIRECLSIRHYEAVYRMYRNLKLRYPHMIFENCAGGGGRTDLGILKYFNHTWVSDNQIMPRSVLIANGMTIALPPERVDRMFAGMMGQQHGSLDAHVRTAMLTHMTFQALTENGISCNPIQTEFIRHSIRLYKEFIRPFLPKAKIFHHTPDTSMCMQEGLCLMEIAAPDGSRGAATAISFSFAGDQRIPMRLKGVAAGQKYRVTLDNSRASFVMGGRELSMGGLILDISASMSSELVLYEAIDSCNHHSCNHYT